MKHLAVWSLALFASLASAKDLGFRYQNGKCLNGQGQEGLNPGYIGQCADFRRITAIHFTFEGADLSGSDFSNSDVQDATFKGANLTGAKFNEATLYGATFEESLLENVDFSGAKLTNVNFSGTAVSRCLFVGSDLSGSDLSFVNFSNTEFKGAVLRATVLDHADLTQVDLRGATLDSASLIQAVVTGSNLSGANFTNANLQQANLSGVNASDSQFTGAVLLAAMLKKANFSTARLGHARLDGANLQGAKFDNSDLRGASLKNAVIDETTLTGAKFSKRTVLPFSSDDAKKRGMLFVSAGSLLIIPDSDTEDQKAEIRQLVNYLDREGADVEVLAKHHSQFDGAKDLSTYTAILDFVGNEYFVDMPDAGQKALVKFVRSGGVYITSQWSGFAVDRQDLLNSMRDLILFTYNSAESGPHPFKAVADKRDHPLLVGMPSDFSMDSAFTVGPLRSFDSNPSVVIVEDDRQQPMVATRDLGSGHVLNFAFASTDGAKTFSLPAVSQIIMNAINW